MNLTAFEKEKLEENKKKIMALVAEAEAIISHPIKSISFICIALQTTEDAFKEKRIGITFDLDYL